MTTSSLTAPYSREPAPVETDALIDRCLAGEESAYLAVYNQYAGLIYRLCYGFLQHSEDAEEVLQDTFEYAFRKLANFDSRKASFKTWLYRIAVSRCHNKRRRKWLPTFSLGLLPGGDIVDERVPAPDERLAEHEQHQRVWQALSSLSPKLRETAILRYFENMSYAEIGQILNIPSKTAESRMRLAHNALRQLLEPEKMENA